MIIGTSAAALRVATVLTRVCAPIVAAEAAQILVKAKRVLDVKADRYLEGLVILIDGAHIVAIGTAADMQAKARADMSVMARRYLTRPPSELSPLIFEAYRRARVAPLDILRAADVNAAELIAWKDRVGSIEPRGFADLIAVIGDTLADISELRRIRFAMKGGMVVEGRADLGLHAG